MSDKRINIYELLKKENKLTKVLCYPAYTEISDPYEKTKTTNFLNPVAIKVGVTQLGFSTLKWAYYGQLPIGSKKIIASTFGISKPSSATLVAIRIFISPSLNLFNISICNLWGNPLSSLLDA